MVTWQRPEHPHNSAEFAEHTGLTHIYPKYMVGGGYVVSGDVAKMIVVTNRLVSSPGSSPPAGCGPHHLPNASVGSRACGLGLKEVSHEGTVPEAGRSRQNGMSGRAEASAAMCLDRGRCQPAGVCNAGWVMLLNGEG